MLARMGTIAPSVSAGERELHQVAERTGYAFGCAFSDSHEFEAEIIRERRAQGAYRHINRPKRTFGWSVAALAGAALTLFFLLS